jgi:hypothetical protein
MALPVMINVSTKARGLTKEHGHVAITAAVFKELFFGDQLTSSVSVFECRFFDSLQVTAEIISQIRPRSLPSASLPIHYSLVKLPSRSKF